jgi:hypothetical protein
MQYEHTQRGWLLPIFIAVAAVLLGAACLARGSLTVAIFNLCVAAVFVIVGLMFGSLSVRDEGEWLALSYGPLPVFRKQIRYADITFVEPGRTAIIDGWGIHYIIGRGWTYNLWGFGCVKLTLGTKVIRVGSDDVDNLTEFLRGKIGATPFPA